MRDCEIIVIRITRNETMPLFSPLTDLRLNTGLGRTVHEVMTTLPIFYLLSRQSMRTYNTKGRVRKQRLNKRDNDYL